jgi:hypothetical protein
VKISLHAKLRAKQRHGLKEHSLIRLAYRARNMGLTHSEMTGSLKRYIDGFCLRHGGSEMRIYGEFVFVFQADVLVTTWQLPNEFKQTVRKLLREKEQQCTDKDKQQSQADT